MTTLQLVLTALATIVSLSVIAAVYWFVVVWNGYIRLKNDVRKAWADIDVILKQRFEELPNVIAAVKGYAAHEQALFEDVAGIRSRYLAAAEPRDKMAADGALQAALPKLFAVAESYPDLKASQNFLQLQQRVSGLEIEISDRRELYNAAINAYNTRLETFPDVFVARLLRLQPLEMFAASPTETQNVDLSRLIP